MLKKKSFWMILGAIAIVLIIIGVWSFFSYKPETGLNKKPAQDELESTGQKVIDALNNNPDQIKNSMWDKLFEEHGAPQGCSYSIGEVSLEGMTNSQKVPDYNGTYAPDDERIKIPIAIEKVHAPLECQGKESQSVDVTYYVFPDMNKWSAVADITKVDVQKN